MVKGPSRWILCKADGRRGIGLRIAIDEESGVIGRSETSGKIHRRGCFANSTFLICDCDNSSQIIPRQRKSSKDGSRMQDVSRGTSIGGGVKDARCFTWNIDWRWRSSSPVGLFHVEHSSASKTANKACLAVQGKVSAGGGDHRPQLISVVKMKMTSWTCSTWNEYSSQPYVVHLRLLRSTMARPRLNRMFHVEHCLTTIDHAILNRRN